MVYQAVSDNRIRSKHTNSAAMPIRMVISYVTIIDLDIHCESQINAAGLVLGDGAVSDKGIRIAGNSG